MPQATPETSQFKQRRHSFRIDQDVIFDFKQIDSNQADKIPVTDQFDDSSTLLLLNELKRLDKDNNQILRILANKNRLLGDYLSAVNDKIDLLARHALFGQNNADQQGKKQTINLSGDGLAFSNNKPVYKDSLIAVRIMFLPTYAPVTAYARVVRCEEQVEDKFIVACHFQNIEDTDQQILSKHILKAQAMARKNQSDDD